MEPKYRFDTETGSFRINDPETGKQWYNQIWNQKGYHMTVTHTGLAHSRYVDEKGMEICLDKKESSCIYIRNDDTGDYWNPGILPVCNAYENYECVHSMKFTSVQSSYKNIFTKVSYAVSENDTYAIWKMELRNRSDQEIHLSLFTGVEFELNGFPMPAYYGANTTTETRFLEKCNAIFCENKNPYVPNLVCHGFVASSEPVIAYEGNFEIFKGTIGNMANPSIIRKGEDCTNSRTIVKERGGVLQNKISIEGNGSKTLYYMLGLCTGESDLKAKYQEMLEECEMRFNDVLEKGIQEFGTLRTTCPENQINHVMNFWAQKQVSFCMLGKKAVRDNAQLAIAMMNYSQELAEKTLEECIEHQYFDGHSILNWQNIGGRDDGKIYSDTSMWLILAICELLKETGNFTFLSKKFRYIDAKEESVYMHLKRAVGWYIDEKNHGSNGLPKIYYADWNDALNIPDENAESVFLAAGICLCLKELIELAKHIGDDTYAQELSHYREDLSSKINQKAFNGKYYVRAISKFGNIGDDDWQGGGKVYINPQTWAILAEIVPKTNLKSVLNTIDYMENEKGIPICVPAYEKFDERVGRMSGMLPGVFENGGVYNHACGFKIMADCKLGRSENALKTLLKVIPDGKSNPSSITKTEPYLLVNCYIQNPVDYMQMWFSWQTGSSAWSLRDYYEGILGMKRSYEGLKIEPCISETWNHVTARRCFRGTSYEFVYMRDSEKGIYVDGRKLSGNILPQFQDDKVHQVIVKL